MNQHDAQIKYKEFRDKIEKDPNYQKWLLYNEILEMVYTEDTKMNQKLPSNNRKASRS